MLRSLRLLVPTLIAAVASPSLAVAQACLGNASFASNHMQVTGGLTSSDTFEELDAALVSGSNSVFAGIGVNSATYNGADGSLRIAGSLGYQVPLSAGGRLQACPLLRAEVGLPTNDFNGTGGELRTQRYGFGLAVGGPLVRGERWAIVPSVQAQVQRERWVVRGGIDPDDFTDTYALIGVAVGFVVNESLSVRPSMSIPSSAPFDEPVYGIGVSLNYGGRR